MLASGHANLGERFVVSNFGTQMIPKTPKASGSSRSHTSTGGATRRTARWLGESMGARWQQARLKPYLARQWGHHPVLSSVSVSTQLSNPALSHPDALRHRLCHMQLAGAIPSHYGDDAIRATARPARRKADTRPTSPPGSFLPCVDLDRFRSMASKFGDGQVHSTVPPAGRCEDRVMERFNAPDDPSASCASSISLSKQRGLHIICMDCLDRSLENSIPPTPTPNNGFETFAATTDCQRTVWSLHS